MSDWLAHQQNVAAGQRAAMAATAASIVAQQQTNTDGIAGNAGNIQTAKVLTDYFKPAGALYETIPRSLGSGDYIGSASGTLRLFAIGLPTNLTVSSITFATNSTGHGTGLTHQWFGLYDMNFAQLATTTDDLTAAWPDDSPKTLAVAATAAGPSATFVTTYEGLHYLGVMVTAVTTMPKLDAATIVLVRNLLPWLCMTDTGPYTAPITFPFTANPAGADDSGIPYAYVS